MTINVHNYKIENNKMCLIKHYIEHNFAENIKHLDVQ